MIFRKDFEYTVVLKRKWWARYKNLAFSLFSNKYKWGHLNIVLRYKQASIWDILELEKSPPEFWYNFFIKNWNVNEREALELFKNFSKIEKTLKSTFLSDIDYDFLEYARRPWDNWKTNESPKSAIIASIFEIIGTYDFEKLYEYTPNQIRFISEGKIWNLKEQDKKGKKENQRTLRHNKLKNDR